MLPDRIGLVKVRANFAGTVELKLVPGDRVWPGRPIALVEGDREIETFSARKVGTILELHVEEGAEVTQGTLLVTLQEDPVAEA